MRNNTSIDFPAEFQLSDCRSVKRVQVPLPVQKRMNGRLILDFEFHTVICNAGLTAASFASD